MGSMPADADRVYPFVTEKTSDEKPNGYQCTSVDVAD